MTGDAATPPTQAEEDKQPPPPRRPQAPAGTEQPEDPRPTAWERLIAIGKDRGFLTPDDLDSLFRTLDVVPPADLGPAYSLLRSMGIEIQQG